MFFLKALPLFFIALVSHAEILEFPSADHTPPADMPWQSIPAQVTAAAVTDLVRSGQAVVVQVNTAEAMKRAAISGVILSPEKTRFNRPWFIVRGAVGLPNLVSAHLEVFVNDTLTLGVGAGSGLLPPIYEGSIRWRPKATCFNCHGRHFLSFGFGIDPAFYFTNGAFSNGSLGVLVVGSVDATYVVRLFKHFGLTLSTRWGIGAGTEFRDRDEDEGYSPSIEPTLKIDLLSVGFVF